MGMLRPSGELTKMPKTNLTFQKRKKIKHGVTRPNNNSDQKLDSQSNAWKRERKSLIRDDQVQPKSEMSNTMLLFSRVSNPF